MCLCVRERQSCWFVRFTGHCWHWWGGGGPIIFHNERHLRFWVVLLHSPSSTSTGSQLLKIWLQCEPGRRDCRADTSYDCGTCSIKILGVCLFCLFSGSAVALAEQRAWLGLNGEIWRPEGLGLEMDRSEAGQIKGFCFNGINTL